MRIIYFLIPFILSATWMSESGVDAIKAGNGAAGYQKSIHCRRVEGDFCFDSEGKDVRRYVVQQFRTGPFEEPSSLTDCLDQADCESQIADVVAKCGDASYSAFWGDIDGDSTVDEEFNSNMDNLESWCIRRELRPDLVFDQILSDAVDVAEAAKGADNTSRNVKRLALRSDLKTCALLFKNGSPTAAQQRQCLFKTMKFLIMSELLTSDL